MEIPITSSEDDVEEQEDGLMYTDSSDLELTRDRSRGEQVIGLRFDNVAISQGAKIASAYVQFTADGPSTATTNLVIRAERTANASTFRQSKHDVSTRVTTEASVDWSPTPWTEPSEQSEKQRTPDLSRMIQQIVSQDDWKAGNAVALVISGTGYRRAVAYDGEPHAAPKLHVEYEP